MTTRVGRLGLSLEILGCVMAGIQAGLQFESLAVVLLAVALIVGGTYLWVEQGTEQGTEQ